jgi:hypothetical protein
MFVKYIQQETGTRVQIKGQGSGFIENETGQEDPDPMHIHITSVQSHLLHMCQLNLLSVGPTIVRSRAQKNLQMTY